MKLNPAPARTATMPTVPVLDGLRACAFLIVFLGHAMPQKYSIYFPATFGVMLFFVLSGYLITSILRVEAEKNGSISLGGFYKRRALRIIPPLYIVFGICMLLSWLGVLWEPVTRMGVISSLGFFYNYAKILGSPESVMVPTGMTLLWSLGVEEHYYLIFPGFYAWMQHKGFDSKRQVRVLLWICAVITLWRAVVILRWPPTIHEGLAWNYAATDMRLDSLLFGAILALRNNPVCGESAPRLDRYPRLTLVVGLLLIALSLVSRDLLMRDLYRFTLQGLGLYLLFYRILKDQQHGWVRWLAWRPLRWIGWLSYTLYLVHHTFLLALNHYVPSHWILDAVGALALSIAFAQLMRWWVEQPLRRLRN
jgi:peptidoglycan/LPS O-acetylase OafA/YrhL